ncbi:MAG: hypothetical protein V2B18_12650, partial [Pseudomonadota bacterium]
SSSNRVLQFEVGVLIPAPMQGTTEPHGATEGARNHARSNGRVRSQPRVKNTPWFESKDKALRSSSRERGDSG